MTRPHHSNFAPYTCVAFFGIDMLALGPVLYVRCTGGMLALVLFSGTLYTLINSDNWGTLVQPGL